ncbi:uncharacterized protein F5147DRAFT_572980 [Suillus discolor]|uniref:Uncharacterized protein n=1 Tax=Suillus discolor TaxID=1912936 RepID=A0A9P7FCS8_9AGAM|nr:uncharacterized protein F5147DRAFT_572980 [Suillus discolor]KAG2112002.1 hypothetical protein F5147DRAFT_572980 [Suillus discolor]
MFWPYDIYFRFPLTHDHPASHFCRHATRSCSSQPQHHSPPPSQLYLSTLTGTQVLLLVMSEMGLIYTFITSKLQPLVTQPEGKNLIQACLNAPRCSSLCNASWYAYTTPRMSLPSTT